MAGLPVTTSCCSDVESLAKEFKKQYLSMVETRLKEFMVPENGSELILCYAWKFTSACAAAVPVARVIAEAEPERSRMKERRPKTTFN
jgi:hypothetical protein